VLIFWVLIFWVLLIKKFFKLFKNSTLLIIEPKPIKAWDGDSFNETILYKLSGGIFQNKYFLNIF